MNPALAKLTTSLAGVPGRVLVAVVGLLLLAFYGIVLMAQIVNMQSHGRLLLALYGVVAALLSFLYAWRAKPVLLALIAPAVLAIVLTILDALISP